MSNTSVNLAFALFAVFASLAASFDRHARSAATRNITTTIGSSGAPKCFQGNRAAAAELNRAEFVHSDGVCRAPQNTDDGPAV
jgi:purine-cytosine permease-like protein